MKSVAIRSIRPAETMICAKIMSATDPWITLRRNYDSCLQVVRDPLYEVYVAESSEGDPVAGFVVVCMKGAFVGYIRALCVAPAFRNQGIGSALLSFAEERIFRDTPNVFLCVSSFNADGQRLYARLGYHQVGELSDYVVRGHSEFLLRKTLGSFEEFGCRQNDSEKSS